MLKWYNKLSIRMKIVGMVLASNVLIALGIFYDLQMLTRKFEAKELDAVQSATVNLASRISAQLYERYGDIQAFAMHPTVKAMDANKIPGVLDQYVALYGIYDTIVVVDKNGKYVASNTVDAGGKKVNPEALAQFDYSKEPWFQDALAGKFTEDKEKAFAGTLIEFSMWDKVTEAAFGEKRVGSSFSTQIKNEKGDLVGVISNRANPKWYENEIGLAFEDVKKQGKDKMSFTLFGQDGKIVAHISPHETDNKIVFSRDEKFLYTETLIKDFPKLNIEDVTKKDTALEINDFENAEHYLAVSRINDAKWPSSLPLYVAAYDDQVDALEVVNEARNNFIFLNAAIQFILIALSLWFSMAIGKQIERIVTTLSGNSKEVADASTRIASSATELSESSTEQAAALQETVAAIDEINAMVEKNTESAQRSKDVSGQSRAAAERGRTTVESMLQAIGQIDQSNEQISTQMNESNRQLSEITQLINDIGSKTKVINEIVFQTKLLSFNASVEAARAGEYGKGFAVVAEEVGNLAQMSGNAAKEITTLLDESVKKVEQIVGETKSRVERLMNDSRDKVKTGAATAEQCNSALEEILENVASVDTLVSEIAVASQEQSSGIREISKAIGQMEQALQQTTSVAQSSSVSAEQLKNQSETLSHVVEDLVHFVRGNSASALIASTSGDSTPPQSKSAATKGKVLPLKKKSPPQVAKAEPSGFKKAVGSEGIPSANDPGFEE